MKCICDGEAYTDSKCIWFIGGDCTNSHSCTFQSTSKGENMSLIPEIIFLANLMESLQDKDADMGNCDIKIKIRNNKPEITYKLAYNNMNETVISKK